MTSDLYMSLSEQERKDSPFSRPPTTGPRNKAGYAQCIKCKQWNVLPGCWGRCGSCIEEAAQLAAVARHNRDQAWESQWKEVKTYSRVKGAQEDWREDALLDLQSHQ